MRSCFEQLILPLILGLGNLFLFDSHRGLHVGMERAHITVVDACAWDRVFHFSLCPHCGATIENINARLRKMFKTRGHF